MEKNQGNVLSMSALLGVLAIFLVIALSVIAFIATKLALNPWLNVLFNSVVVMAIVAPIVAVFAYQPLKLLRAEHHKVLSDLQVAMTVFETNDGVTVTDANTNILNVNQAFTKTTGYSHEEVIGKTPAILKSGLHDEAFYQEMWQKINNEGTWQGEVLDKRKNGEIYPNHLTITAVKNKQNEVTHYVGVHTDISDVRKVKNDLARAGLHDPLTGLPNRLQFSERLRLALAQHQSDHMLAVVMIDLDHFKPINDTYGHEIGDKVLMEVSNQLKLATRETDVIARLGGDEFVILLNELTDINACQHTLERLRVALANPYMIDGLKLNLSASIGASIYPEDHSDADGLLRHADEAMYIAKHGGKNRCVLFDASAAAQRSSLQQRLADIHHALDNNELTLQYQPQVDMKAGEIIGMEALIRWKSPKQGLVMPNDFMPLVENSELAIPVGCFVIISAIKQLSLWRKLGFNWRVCINVSPRHLEHPSFIDSLELALMDYPDVPPDMVELEIVESSALEDIERAVNIMHEVSKLGVQFALDDFGTGHASLTYLRRLPVRTLKIDRSFVRDMLEDPSDLIMIEGITSLATTFDHVVLAEGVENLNLGSLLIQIGCHQAQGYAIARSMPALEVESWAKIWRSDPGWQQVARREWRREDLPLLYAAMSHRIWINNMQALVDGRSATIPQLDERLSRFGVWQYGLGFKRYGKLPEFASIVPIHKEIHKTGRTMVKYLTEHHVEGAKLEMQKLFGLRDQLIAKMDLLAERVTAD
ncbi:MAG: EAL domain-containing protein [Methylophilaceae bacterium]